MLTFTTDSRLFHQPPTWYEDGACDMILFFLLQRFLIRFVMMEGKAGFIPASVYIHVVFALTVVFYGVCGCPVSLN